MHALVLLYNQASLFSLSLLIIPSNRVKGSFEIRENKLNLLSAVVEA